MQDSYTCFYTSRRFWVGEPIDLDRSDIRATFTDLMSEVVHSYSTPEFKLNFCKDGMVMLQVHDLEAEMRDRDDTSMRPIEEIVTWWGRYLDFLNALYLLMDSACIEVGSFAYFDLSEITNKDAFRMFFENGKFKAGGTTERFLQGRDPNSHVRPFMRRPLQKEIFDNVFRCFSVVAEDDPLRKSVATIAKSIAEYKVGNYETSLVLSWFVIESQIRALWKVHLNLLNRQFEDGSMRVSSRRRKQLIGRDYPVSVISNILELSSMLSIDDLRRIDTVRSYRNQVVHRDPSFSASASHCQESIDLAVDMTVKDKGVNVIPNLGYSIGGG